MITKNKTVPFEKENLDFIEGRIKEARDSNDSDFNRFIILTCAIDAIANCWIGVRSSDAARFVYIAFVELCMDGYNQTVSLDVNVKGKSKTEKIGIAELLYDYVRCSVDHNFKIGEYVYLTGSCPQLHRQKLGKNNGIIFDVNELEKDIRSAIKKLREKAKSNVEAPLFVEKNGEWYLNFDKKKSSRFLSKEDAELAESIKNFSKISLEVEKASQEYRCIEGLIKRRKECKQYRKKRYADDVNEQNKGKTLADTLGRTNIIPRVIRCEEAADVTGDSHLSS